MPKKRGRKGSRKPKKAKVIVEEDIPEVDEEEEIPEAQEAEEEINEEDEIIQEEIPEKEDIAEEDEKLDPQAEEDDIIEEEISEEEEYIEEEDTAEEDEEHDPEEDVWNAVEWEDMGPTSGGDVVFAEASVKDILKDLVDQAWEDGVITDDEMAMLRVLKGKLNIDDQTFEEIMDGSRPVPGPDQEEESGKLAEIEEGPSELPEEDEPAIDDVPMATPLNVEDVSTDVPPPPREEKPAEQRGKPGEGMITLTSSVRGGKRPLGESFDLTPKKENSFKKRCPHCRSLIKVDPGKGKNTCPICGRQLVEKKEDSPALRKILDQAKEAFKQGDKDTAKELYTIALAQSKGNKEAMFYLQKLQHKKGAQRSFTDARNISIIETGSNRLDQLMKGGVQVGYQVLLKGPAFCGKEVLLDKVMASALNRGLPVIYVSSNRAMKEVMRGIIKQAPDFKSYNQQGLVRMYDLFSKYKDGRVLKEGHRIFNIEDRDDFKKFQEDIVILLDELVRDYHGGLMIINSLSPLITQADQTDLMKFLQVLIARSKSYRFTNILDMAAGVHSESVENSVEYLMDGIIEFKETDSKNQLRLKGFRNNALTKDWVDYRHDDSEINIVGSFMEERIL